MSSLEVSKRVSAAHGTIHTHAHNRMCRLIEKKIGVGKVCVCVCEGERGGRECNTMNSYLRQFISFIFLSAGGSIYSIIRSEASSKRI